MTSSSSPLDFIPPFLFFTSDVFENSTLFDDIYDVNYDLWRLSSAARLLDSRNAQTIEPTIAWAALSSPNANTWFSLLQFSGEGRAL